MKLRLFAPVLAVVVLAGCADKPALVNVREKGDYYAETKQDEKALGQYRDYLTRKPEDTEVRYKYANTLSRLGMKSEAREQFCQLVDIAPTDDRFLDGYTVALYEAGEIGELNGFLTRMTTQRGSVRDWIRMGEFNQKSGDLDGAKAAYQAAARLDGGRSTAPWVAMADMYKSIGDTRNEKAMVERALFIAPQDPPLTQRYRSLGGIPGPSAGVRPEEWVEPMKKK